MTRKKGSSNASGKGSQQAIERYRTKTTRRGHRRMILFVSALSIAAILIVFAIIATMPPYPARTPSPGSLNSVPIISGPPFAYHRHVHLDIFLDGTLIPVPSNHGNLPGGRLYALHAHDNKNIIHMEPPVGWSQPLTLGQIFLVWGWPLDSNHIFDKTGPVSLHVNNGAASIPFDANTPLRDHDEIALVWGTPPASIPSSYDWGSVGL